MITTIHGEMDEALLILREGLVDNENERTTTVEYCLPGCKGQAHVTGTPDADSHFCNYHIHRSGHVVLKKGIELFAKAASLGSHSG